MNNIPEIIYLEDNLFLNCPKCKETAYLELNKKDANKLNINCFKCNNKSLENLDEYMLTLSNLSSPTEVKCEKHNTYLDKFCYKCHKQFCSECDMNNHINCSPIKTIRKIITKEKIDETKKNINEYKENFKNYIKTYMEQYFINQPEVSKEIILESLMSPYIQKMIFFFQFCDCIILNYNIDYPDFYEQMNLKTIFSIFNSKIELMSLNSNNVENLFNYEDNNYISKNKVTLTFKETQNNINLQNIDNYFQLNKETEIVSSYEGIKIIKNGNCINTIKKKLNEVEFHKINDENFAIIQRDSRYGDVTIGIFSMKYNEVLSSRNYIVYKYIFNLDNDTFAITSSNYTLIQKIEDKEVKKVKEINMEKPNYEYRDSILIPGTEYILTLFDKEIYLQKKDDFSLVKTINIGEMYIFTNFYIDDCGRIFLGGYKIGILDLNNSKVIVLHDDKIKKFQGYLAGVESNIEYSNFVFTYFNKIICNRHIHQIQGSTYDDIPNVLLRDENEIYVFENDPESNEFKLIEKRKDIYGKCIDLSDKNEIRICNSKGVHLYCID